MFERTNTSPCETAAALVPLYPRPGFQALLRPATMTSWPAFVPVLLQQYGVSHVMQRSAEQITLKGVAALCLEKLQLFLGFHRLRR